MCSDLWTLPKVGYTIKIVKKLWVLIIINLAVLNFGVFYLFYRNIGTNFLGDKEAGLENSPVVQVKESCNDDCRKSTDLKIEEIQATLNAMQIVTTITPALKVVNRDSVPRKVTAINYVPIPGSGSTLNTSWTSIPGTDFYLSKADYSGLAGVYFEVNMKLINGNGSAFVRLFDASHGVGIPGSELSTSSQISTFITSKSVSLTEGYNHYQVQIRSLTADTTVYESGRLKIITEN